MNWLERRVDKLESAAGIGDKPNRVALIILQPGENEDDAIAKHRAEHPEEPPGSTDFAIIRIVDP